MAFIRPVDATLEGLKFYTWTFFNFLFLINPPCSAAAQWMAIKCISEVPSQAKLQQLVYRDLVHPFPNFHRGGVKKCEIWRRLKHHSTLSRSRLKMQQDIRMLKQISCVWMIALCHRPVWWSWVYASLRTVCHRAPPLELHGENC